MSAHGPFPQRAEVFARAALMREPLIKDGKHWRFRRRLFAPVTINRLIEAGEARRFGPFVEAIRA